MAIINAVTLRHSFTIATAALLTSCLAASAQINITGADGQTINLGPNGIDIRSGGSHVRLSPGSINATSSGTITRVSTRSSKMKVKSKAKTTARLSASARGSSSSSTVVINKHGKAGTSHVSMQSRNGVSSVSTNVNGRQAQYTAAGPASLEADTNGTTINGIRINDNTVSGINRNNSAVEVITSQALSLSSDLAVNDNHRNFVYNANNHGIAIYGNHCTIQLQGPCREIAIYGNHNTVIAEVVGRVAVMGNYNATRWTSIPAPQVVVLGKDNQIQGPGYP